MRMAGYNGYGHTNEYGSGYSNESPSSFAGGGFIEASPGGAVGDSPNVAGKQFTVQSLTPVTIRQLQNASQGPMDDSFSIDGKVIQQVTVCGAVTNIHYQNLHMNIEIEDGSGRINVRMYMDNEAEDDTDYTNFIKTNLKIGHYIKAFGHLRKFMDTKNVVAHIQIIEDYNEVTHHFLECIYVHLFNLRGPLRENTETKVVKNSQTVQFNPNSRNEKNEVLEFIKSCHSENGRHINEIITSLAHIDPQRLREHIHALASDDALIYPVNDDDHFRAVC